MFLKHFGGRKSLSVAIMAVLFTLAACNGDSSPVINPITATLAATLNIATTTPALTLTIATPAAKVTTAQLTATVLPTISATPAVAVSSQTNGPLQIASGGVGLLRADWEKLHGKAENATATKNGLRANYEQGYYAVEFSEQGVAYYIRVQFDKAPGKTKFNRQTAQTLGKSLLPADIEFDRVNVNDDDIRMEIFSSKSLTAQFEALKKTYPQVQWPSGQSGKIGQVAIYYNVDPATEELLGLNLTTLIDRQAT